MSDFIEATRAVSGELACQGCGAMLKFQPGTVHLSCEYCGAANEIASLDVAGKAEEKSLSEFLAKNFETEEKVVATVVKCESCGASSSLEPSISSDKCPFCSASLVIKSGSVATLHKPHCVLPFGIDHVNAKQKFAGWLKGLWFAPNDLKHYADSSDKLTGMYLPFWTFDCSTDSSYTGQRGEDYYVDERYSAIENGKSVSKTRRVTKTRWYPASGVVKNSFDDILIEATHSLNKQKLRELEPWDLNKIMPYNDKYLSGFRTETYTSDVKTAYEEAKQRMEPVIHGSIRQDIGGDRQLIQLVNTTFHNPTFKHILLPVWISAFRYKGKVYQFLVNARTGEVQGDRPFSAAKIAFAVVGAIVLLLIAWTMSNAQ